MGPFGFIMPGQPQPSSPEMEENFRRRIGTSLFTLGAFPIEYTYYGEQYRAEWEADAVDTIGAAFLGSHGENLWSAA